MQLIELLVRLNGRVAHVAETVVLGADMRNWVWNPPDEVSAKWSGFRRPRLASKPCRSSDRRLLAFIVPSMMEAHSISELKIRAY